MNWTRPITGIVEAIIALWLVDLFFRPRAERKADGEAKQ